MKLALHIALVAAIGNVYAADNHQTTSNAMSGAEANTSSHAAAVGGKAYGGAGGNGFGGMGGTGGDAAGASNNVQFDQVRQWPSPSVLMSAPMPTAPCQASIGGFLSFIGGAGFAYSRTLQECEKRETARMAWSIGQSDMAKELICMTEYGSQTTQCQKP